MKMTICLCGIHILHPVVSRVVNIKSHPCTSSKIILQFEAENFNIIISKTAKFLYYLFDLVFIGIIIILSWDSYTHTKCLNTITTNKAHVDEHCQLTSCLNQHLMSFPSVRWRKHTVKLGTISLQYNHVLGQT